MNTFERINNDFVLSKEIDEYLEQNGFEKEKYKDMWQKVYSKKGFVTFVKITNKEINIYKEDDVETFLFEKSIVIPEEVINDFSKFVDLINELYQVYFS